MAREDGRGKRAQDASGTYVKNLGWKKDSGTKQHRFYKAPIASEGVRRDARISRAFRWQTGDS